MSLKKYRHRSDRINLKEVERLVLLKYNIKSIAIRFNISYSCASKAVAKVKKKINFLSTI